MKKIFSFLAAAAMLFAASCTKDNVGTDNGNDTQVTFNLSLEGQSGTRAIGDGLSVNKLYFAVYGENDDKTAFTLLPDASVNAATADRGTDGVAFDGTYNLSLKLAKDQTYKVVFWAHKEVAQGEQYYTFDSAKGELTVNYNVNGNIEERDAFFKVETITVTGSKQINVVLTRPFAQLNVGVTAKDYQDAEHSGVVITKSWAKVTGVYNTLNLLDGSVSNVNFNGEATFAMAATPKAANETLTVGQDAFEYLSMNYVLVGAKKNVAAEFEFATNSYVNENNKGKTITFNSGLNVVPVQRNYRTNLVGQILTGNLDFNVTIDEDFTTDNNVNLNEATTVAELKLAAKNGGTITLAANIEITEPLVFEKSSILNLNGKTLKGAVVVSEGGNLIVNEGVIENTDENFSGITSNGNLTLNDVNITSARHALRVESGNVVINGGTYRVAPQSAKTVYALNIGDDGKVANVTIKGGTFVGPKGTMADSGGAIAVRAGSKATIEGGNFSGGKNKTLSNKGTMIITGGTFDQNPDAMLAEGYKALAKGGKYYVVAEQVDAVVGSKEDLPKTTDGTKFNTIFEENVTLFGDITVSAGETNANSGYKEATGVEVTNGAVLDGQGNTLTINDANTTWSCAIAAKGGTIKNLTVSGAMRGIFMPGANGDVYIDNVIFKNVIYTFNSDDGNKNYGVYISNSTLNGWTSHSDVHKEVVYTNCKFGEGNGYAFCRPYGPTTFKGCDFEEGFKVDPVGKVTFENCTLNGVAITAENVATLVTNTANATVK